MFWWFERNGVFLRCEVVDSPGGGYDLRISDPNGIERVEHFPDSSGLARRQQTVERELAAEGWTGPHGWNL